MFDCVTIGKGGSAFPKVGTQVGLCPSPLLDISSVLRTAGGNIGPPAKIENVHGKYKFTIKKQFSIVLVRILLTLMIIIFF